jgi:DNA-binding transcriptional ArsR family regulator
MTYAHALSALSDPNRRAIVERLRVGPQNVATLARDLPISRPAVSQHLKILCGAGLLKISPRGTSRFYSLAPEGLQDLRHYLNQLWDDALSAFAQHVETDEKYD